MEVSRDSLPERKGQLLLEIVQCGVDGGTRDGEEEQCCDLLQEFCETLIDDGLDDSSIYISEPDTHESSHHKQECQNIDVLSFFSGPRGKDFAEKLFYSLPEKCIDIAFAQRGAFPSIACFSC